MAFVWGSVDLISRRISSSDFAMKVDSMPGGLRRRPLIMSSMERWKRESINEGPAIQSILQFLLLLCMNTCSRDTNWPAPKSLFRS